MKTLIIALAIFLGSVGIAHSEIYVDIVIPMPGFYFPVPVMPVVEHRYYKGHDRHYYGGRRHHERSEAFGGRRHHREYYNERPRHQPRHHPRYDRERYDRPFTR